MEDISAPTIAHRLGKQNTATDYTTQHAEPCIGTRFTFERDWTCDRIDLRVLRFEDATSLAAATYSLSSRITSSV